MSLKILPSPSESVSAPPLINSKEVGSVESGTKLARIKPFEYIDKLTGHKIAIKVSPYYSTLIVDERVYYFNKETGEFDGTSIPTREKGAL